MAHDVREQTVESLSTELLSVILLNAVSMYKHEENPVNLHEQLESFERLRLVCHRWNNAIEADPCFWSSCGVTIPKNTDGLSQITSILHALENFFSRSGSLRLTLGIYWPFLDSPSLSTSNHHSRTLNSSNTTSRVRPNSFLALPSPIAHSRR
ncbi:hypothetical protein BKA70DRAFT_579170 [Coprinopsis sp. MPI-PUGE-AT-0042]|nr:hypothetical protein BKA70DRAFT_579170 [Coprinopsis sp. MPI-PUGE-AT-0042]